MGIRLGLGSIPILVLLALSGRAHALEASGHGAGTIEARVQTPTNAPAEALSLWSSPGFYYDPDSEDYLLNLIGGAGIFVADGFAVGLDVGYQRLSLDGDVSWYGTVAPFLKVVTGLDEGKFGFFAEASPGLLFTNDKLIGRGKHFVLGGWTGLNMPFGRSLSLMTGPSIVSIGNVASNGGFPAVVGWRLGISVYVPGLAGPDKSPAPPPVKTAGKLPTIELRLHTASQVAGGGGVGGATAGRGVFYATRPKFWVANLTGGAAAFVIPWLGVGLDFATSNYAGRLEGASLSFAPFLKVVTGLPTQSLGVFFEASPGLVLARQVIPGDPLLREERFAGLWFQGWGGAHVPFGGSAALVAGPAAGWLEDMDHLGDRGSGYVGFRFGVSVYVP